MSNDGNSIVTLSGVGYPDPKSIGTCRIEARIPAGKARLYRAVDLSLGKTVVVKLMTPPHDEDAASVERFLAFGNALVGVKSPHIVSVLRAGRDGPTPYLVLDYVDGEDLETVLKRERALPPQSALRAVLDAASGLEVARARGVLHGDLRPRHLLRARGDVKVTSFGLSPPYRSAQGRELTGHPGYLAPEVILGHAADHRADIYALGCTLFELLAAQAPFGSGSADALLACHVHEPFPSVAAIVPRVPPELDAFLMRLVARNPERRFSSYTELLQAGASLLPTLRNQQAHQPTLLVEDGRQQGTRVAVPEGELLLGRVPGEGFAIDDARVSRRHALVRRAGDALEIEDLQSRNGIRVNGVEVRSRKLQSGDRIEIGDSVLRVDIPSSATSPPAELRIPESPVRGAYGDVEVSHVPARQVGPDALTSTDGPALAERMRLLARLSALFAARPGTPDLLRADALAILADAVHADDRVLVRVRDGKPLLEARSGDEASLLSATLPAIERALPGQLSLMTTVRVNVDDLWMVALAPILERGSTRALAIVVRKRGRFDESALAMVEATCALLSLRSAAATAG